MLGRNEIMVIKSEVQKNLFFYFTPVLIKNFIVCFFCRRCIYTAYIVNILNRDHSILTLGAPFLFSKTDSSIGCKNQLQQIN